MSRTDAQINVTVNVDIHSHQFDDPRCQFRKRNFQSAVRKFDFDTLKEHSGAV